MSKMSEIIAAMKHVKRISPHGKTAADEFFDITPFWDQELENFCDGLGSQLTLEIAKRLLTRSPKEALAAIMMHQKKQSCGRCGKLWNNCECPIPQNNMLKW